MDKKSGLRGSTKQSNMKEKRGLKVGGNNKTEIVQKLKESIPEKLIYSVEPCVEDSEGLDLIWLNFVTLALNDDDPFFNGVPEVEEHPRGLRKKS